MKIIYPKEYSKLKNYLKRDLSAKSYSFYLKKNIKIDKTIYDFLINFSSLNNNSDVRICIHFHPSDKHHDMIILQGKNSHSLPHKHLKKGDTVHVIQGKLGVIIYSKTGRILSKNFLNKNEIYRIKQNQYHWIYPLTKFVVYHENKNGPLLKVRDSIFLKWNMDLKKNKNIINTKKFKSYV